MIKRLFIKDFAIINELELSIKDGLTIITGETGAGKSIILKSLGIAPVSYTHLTLPTKA